MELRKISARTAGLQVRIRNRDLSKTKHECWPLKTTFGNILYVGLSEPAQQLAFQIRIHKVPGSNISDGFESHDTSFGASESPDKGFGYFESPDIGYGDFKSPDIGLGDSESPDIGFGNFEYPDIGFGNFQSPDIGFGDYESPDKGFGDF